MWAGSVLLSRGTGRAPAVRQAPPGLCLPPVPLARGFAKLEDKPLPGAAQSLGRTVFSTPAGPAPITACPPGWHPALPRLPSWGTGLDVGGRPLPQVRCILCGAHLAQDDEGQPWEGFGAPSQARSWTRGLDKGAGRCWAPAQQTNGFLVSHCSWTESKQNECIQHRF